ncbi:hypothetical protein [Dictyobacter arantiisoli]|uniref:Uncharacterized protein n=1 Tax=Dictyobacter arantiisoli TaxID=2014874 RepID=A0A5A5TFQ1_9CHLR|nr:hypothetical protein [Dictyobacter arantiisoli]GCF09819.1 hypothetical protein KDI_33830 [Dictyobacter arantiisoli]
MEGDFRPLREYHGSPTRLSHPTEIEVDAVSAQEEEDIIPAQLSLLEAEEKGV